MPISITVLYGRQTHTAAEIWLAIYPPPAPPPQTPPHRRHTVRTPAGKIDVYKRQV